MLEVVVALAASDCERLHPGWLAQPANAVSSLAYVAVGVWVLLRSGRGGVDRRVLLTAGLAMAGVGVGSFAYHGPQPAWASVAHNAGVWTLVLVIIVETAWTLARSTTRRMTVAACRSAACWMAPALVAYVAGRADSPLCDPAATWQFHSVWHVLSAVGLGRLSVNGRQRDDARPLAS